MLSKLRKISKDLIIYSVLVAEYERLDFKNDALAGVRANYFNAKCSPQTEKTDITIDNRVYNLGYSMKKGEPLSWKINADTHPVQTVKRSAGGGYCVMSYGDNGIIYKRQFFGGDHAWLRTEYYDRRLENTIVAVIYPRRAEGLFLLRLQRFLPSGVTTVDLYPSLDTPKKRCTALMYSNSGMIWYDERFKPTDFTVPTVQQKGGGFAFSRESFGAGRSVDMLELQNAPYLSEDDILTEEEPAAPVQPEPETYTYSAYERIANILFEAHKTNKNIFGELAGYPMEEPATEKTDAAEEQPDTTEEAADADETVEAVAENAENTAEPEAITAVPEEEPETALEAAADEEQADAEVFVKPDSEPEADVKIATKNAAYAYFGTTDEDGKRTGLGRTVTPEGLTSYDGEYLADKRHGFGVCYYKEGSPNYIGDWENGNRSGRGVGFRRSDGTLHAGKWTDNKPDGFGARFDRDGGFLDVCTYVGGVRNGKSVSFDEDGNVVIRLWKNGELISEKLIAD